MALALESLTFSVETKELENAILKMKELGQAASSLNKPIEQLGKQSSESAKKVEKVAESVDKMSSANRKTKSSADGLSKSNDRASSSASKLEALIQRLSNTYMDLSNGMTRGESNILNAARTYGALETQLEPVRKVLEQIKELSKDPFDAAIGSVRRISQEFDQFKQRADLATQGIYLSTKQLQEYSKIANEVKGKLISAGVKEGSAEYQQRFAAMLAETNKQYLDYVSKLNIGISSEKERNKALVEQERLMQAQEKLLQQRATAMDDVARKWKFMQSQKAEQEVNKALQEQNRLLQQGSVMMDSVVGKWKFMQSQKADQEANKALQEQNRLLQQGSVMMDSVVAKFKANKMAEEQRTLNAQLVEQNRLLTQGAVMMNSAVSKYKAIQIAEAEKKVNDELRERNRLLQQGATALDDAVILFRNRQAKAVDDVTRAEAALIEQEQRLQFVTQKTSDGFTVASANSLYRYQESLKRAGVTEQEFIARSSAYASALKARQTVSDDNKQRTAAAQELLRIEQQLGDQEKFVAYAIAETNKQQQQATTGAQQFADTLNIGSLRALFAYEQALRRAGVAEAEVTSKSEQMRQQMLKMQQATESFNGSVNHLGRNIGVQFTDIFVSLYNGQPVMQVITQQGGQLADAFLLAGVSGQNMSQHLVAGFKNILESYKLLFAAFAGLAGAGIAKVFSTLTPDITTLQLALDKSIPKAERFSFVMSELSNVMTATAKATAFLAVTTGVILAVEAYKSVKAYDELTTNLIRYGGAVYGGIEGTKEYANELQRAGWSAGQASEFITAVAKAGNLSSEQMREMASVAKDLDTWLNISFEDTAKLYSEIKKAPLDTIIKLAKETGLVSDAVVENIIQYERAGNTQGAVMAAMNEATRVHGEQVKLAEKNYSDFARTIIKVGEAVRKGYQNLFAYFVEASTPEDLLKTQLESVEETLSGKGMLSKMSLALMPEQAKKDLMVQRDQLKAQLDLLKQQREEQVKIAEQSQKNKENSAANLRIQQQLQTGLNKPDAKKLNQEQYVNAFLEEQRRLNKGIILDEQTIKMYREQAIKDWKSANESNTRAKTSFSTKTSNEVQEVKRQYDQELQLEQKLLSDKLAVMKNYHDNGFTKTSEYLSREQQLVIASRNKQLQILEQYNRDELAAFDNKAQALNAAAANAIKGGGNAAAINKQLGQNLEDLNRQRQTFIESISGKEEKVWSSSLKELSKNMDDVAATTAGVIKVANDYSNEIEKQQINRQAEIEMLRESIALSEKEIAVLKAKTEAEKQYNAVIKKLERGVEDASNMMLDFYNNLDMSDFGAIETSMDRGWQLYVQYEKAKEALTKARLQGEEEQRNAVSDAALAYELQNYKKLKDGIADAIATALFEGGEEGKKQLRDIIVAELRKPITLQINAFVNAVLSDVIGLPGNESTGQGTNSGILGNLSSLNSAYKLINNSISSSITKGFTSFATSDAGIKMGLGTSNASAVGPVKPGLTSTGTAVSSALTMAGNATAGYGIQKSISGGYKTGESELVDAATVIASAIYGPVAGAAAGVFNRAFGKKLKDQGIEGTFGTSDGFDGNTYEFYKGGWLRSDKTKRKPMDAGVEDALETQFKTLQTQTALMAQTLGLSTDSVVNFTSKIKISFKGLNEEQIGQRMAEEFGKVAESMASVALGETEYARTGETAVETLTRLSSSLTTVNGTFDVLGQTLYASSLVGADMASQLVDLMGGLENFTNITAIYYANFYTEAERADTATRQLTEALTSIGIDTIPTTREAFRDLVEAQDLTTESGRETFAALMQLSTAFAANVDFVETIEQAYSRLSNALKSNEEIAQQRIDLEQRLFEATASTVDVANKAAAGIAEYNRALYGSVLAAEEARRVSESLAAFAKESNELQVELLQSQGKTIEAKVAIRALAIEGLSPAEVAAWDFNQSLRDTIEATNQAKQANEEYKQSIKDAEAAYETALQNLASATDAVKAVQEKATTAYLSAKDRELQAQEKIAELQAEQQRKLRADVEASNKELLDLSKTLKEFVYGDMTSPSKQFSEALKKALAGDKEAMTDLPGLAKSATEAAYSQAGTLEQARLEQSKINRKVLDAAIAAEAAIATVPNAPEEEDPLVVAQRELTAAQRETADALRVVTAIQAPLTASIEDLIAEYQNAVKLESQRAADVLAAAQALDAIVENTAATTTAISLLEISLENLKVRAELEIKATQDAIAGSDLSEEIKDLLNGTTDTLKRTISAIVANEGVIGIDAASILGIAVEGTSRTIKAIVENSGTLGYDAVTVLGIAADGISKTLQATVANAGSLGTDAAKFIGLATEDLSKVLTASIENKGSLSKEAITLIGSTSATLARTLATTITNPSTDPKVAELLGATTSGISRTIKATITQSGTTPDAITNLKLGVAEAVSKNISAVLTNPTYSSDVSLVMKELLAADSVVKNLLPQINTSSLTTEQAALFNNIMSSTTKDIKLGGSVSMSTGLETLLGGILDYTKQTADNTALQYFAANPDVAKAYSENTYDKTLAEFAKYHFATYGINEGRLWGNGSATATTPPPVVTPPVVTKPVVYDKSKVLDSYESMIDYSLRITGFTATGYLSKNKDVADVWGIMTSAQKSAFGNNKDLYAAWHYGQHGVREKRLFANGGYTGPGGVYEPAGIVHRGEVVFSQKDIANLGGVGVVEGIRTGEIPMFANGGIVSNSPSGTYIPTKDDSELVEELRNLREEVKMLRAEARATAVNTSKATRILDNVTQGGTEIRTKEVVAA